MKMNLDSTFDKLAKEAVDKAHEATRTYFSLRPEERTAAAANVVVRALKEADAPLQEYAQVLRIQAKIPKMLAKAAKLKAWLEGKEGA
jgi:hypothetical protein